MVVDINGWDMFSAEGRTLQNTPKEDYNCGGYALNLYNWFNPYWRILLDCELQKENINLLNEMVDYMLKHIKGLRKIDTCKNCDIKKEIVIAFRVGGSDFHFIKRGQNNVWYSKMGCSSEITRISKKDVFSEKWYNRYDSPIILFALKI
jgi:hypothetical protein